MFSSATAVASLNADNFLPITGTWTKNSSQKIHYWQNNLMKILVQSISDQLVSQNGHSFATDMKKMNIIFAGGHVQGAFRAAVKVLFIDGNTEESKCIGESITNIGHIDHSKDDYEVLQNTIIPKIDSVMATIQGDEARLCIPPVSLDIGCGINNEPQ